MDGIDDVDTKLVRFAARLVMLHALVGDRWMIGDDVGMVKLRKDAVDASGAMVDQLLEAEGLTPRKGK